MLHDWFYIILIVAIMAFFCLGFFFGRLSAKRRPKKIPTSVKLPKEVSEEDLAKVQKFIENGATFEETLRYCKVNCNSYPIMIDRLDELYSWWVSKKE